MEKVITRQLHQQLIYDKKWHLFLKRARLFRHIPFIDFVFGSGSMAIGNVDDESDFDVLVGVRTGRIFTARFMAAVCFALYGWRRAKEHGGHAAQNKICLNHFVTPSSYQLHLSPNSYWRLLYKRLVPVYGSVDAMQRFLDANTSWLSRCTVESTDQRLLNLRGSWISYLCERVLAGLAGDFLERILKSYQVARIKRGIHKNSGVRGAEREIRIANADTKERIELAPLILYSDEELEFHPDPAVIYLDH